VNEWLDVISRRKFLSGPVAIPFSTVPAHKPFVFCNNSVQSQQHIIG